MCIALFRTHNSSLRSHSNSGAKRGSWSNGNDPKEYPGSMSYGRSYSMSYGHDPWRVGYSSSGGVARYEYHQFYGITSSKSEDYEDPEDYEDFLRDVLNKAPPSPY